MRKLSSLFLFISVLTPFVFFGCKKADDQSHAQISVLDAQGAPVAGAIVSIHPDTVTQPGTGMPAGLDPSWNIVQQGTTLADGKTPVMNFPNAEMVLFMEAKNGGLTASGGTIHLMPGTTVQDTIYLK